MTGTSRRHLAVGALLQLGLPIGRWCCSFLTRDSRSLIPVQTAIWPLSINLPVQSHSNIACSSEVSLSWTERKPPERVWRDRRLDMQWLSPNRRARAVGMGYQSFKSCQNTLWYWWDASIWKTPIKFWRGCQIALETRLRHTRLFGITGSKNRGLGS